MSRRGLLLGAGAAVLAVRLPAAQGRSDREHRVDIDVPILAEEPTAVPIRISVDHPMEEDHFIRSIEVSVEQDPVPSKGRFLFSPLNGRAWVAFQMRSGSGGLVRAVAECSRHGTFTAVAETRVVEGGCSTPPERGARERAGNPELRVPGTVRIGEVVEVRARVIHGSYTGLALRRGKFVADLPPYYVRQMLVFLDGEKVSEFQMTSAVSPNPLIRFPVRAGRSGTLRVVFVNSEDQRWEVSRPLRG